MERSPARPPDAPSTSPAVAAKAEKKQGVAKRAQRLAGEAGRTGDDGGRVTHARLIHQGRAFRQAYSLRLRTTSRASAGPASSTKRKRAVCSAMTKERSTWPEAAAMMAIESMPPGLVAR